MNRDSAGRTQWSGAATVRVTWGHTINPERGHRLGPLRWYGWQWKPGHRGLTIGRGERVLTLQVTADG